MKNRILILSALLLASCQSAPDLTPEPQPEGPRVNARIEPWAASESYLVIIEIEDPEHPGQAEYMQMPRIVVGAGQEAELEMRADAGSPIARARVNIPSRREQDQSALVQVEWLKNGVPVASAPVRVALPDARFEGPDPRRFSASFVEQDVRAALDHIAHRSGVNVIASPDVDGTITLALEELSWQGALQSIAEAIGCSVTFEANNTARIAAKSAKR